MKSQEGTLVALVSPHAGYQYSGLTAAHGFRVAGAWRTADERGAAIGAARQADCAQRHGGARKAGGVGGPARAHRRASTS